MLSYQTLAQTSDAEVLAVFNGAFADYQIPFHLSPEQYAARMNSDSLRLPISVGAFDEGRLVGIILHGDTQSEGRRIVYNGGTGVLPSYRGQGITAAMYAYILPLFKEQGVGKVQLEVIASNFPALKIYERVGFGKDRTMDCYKGTLALNVESKNNVVRKLENYHWPEMRAFWDIRPSWQNDVQAITNLGDTLDSYGYYEKETLLGYLIFNPRMRRIMQLAVHTEHRQRGIGRALVQQLASEHGPEVSIINVERSSPPICSFLAAVGLHPFLEMYEMSLTLDDSQPHTHTPDQRSTESQPAGQKKI
jgi:ribosomal protein S18 acetylase RimI-like enzyme